VTLFVIATICLVVFVAWELLHDSPLVDLRLFRFLPFSMACLVVFFSTCAFRGTGVLTIVYMQQVLDLTPLRVGWLLLAGNIAYGLAVVAAGRMADKIDPSISVIAGLWVFALGFFYFATMNETITAFVLIMLLTSRLASYGMVGSPNNLSAMRAIPDTEVVMGSGLFALIRGIAGAIGPVVSATYLDQRYAFHVQRYADQPDALSWSLQHAQTAMHHFLQWAGEAPTSLSVQTVALMHQRLLAEATTAAYQDYFIIAALAAVAGILPALPWEKMPGLWRSIWGPVSSQPIAMTPSSPPLGPVKSTPAQTLD
jgi:MFS family permease